jgi:hypothetical protein
MLSEDFYSKGYYLAEQFLSEPECENLLALIENYRKHHSVPEIYREAGERPLRYRVIDGECIKRYLPEVLEIYRNVNDLINQIAGERLVPLNSEKVACNINIMNGGGTYRWHYDRNAVTAILYLNEATGGETECYPNYRIFLKNVRFSRLQQLLDRFLQIGFVRRIFGKQLICAPRAGRMLIMRGDRCLHSVRPLIGRGERINIIMSFDTPGAEFAVADQLDSYLYTQTSAHSADPNYKG